MKLIKKMTCAFFALLMVITMIAVPTPTLAAETTQAKTSVPTRFVFIRSLMTTLPFHLTMQMPETRLQI